MANELKRLDLSKPSFQAGGKTYHIESTMSIERYSLFQQFELELGYNLSFKQMFDSLTDIYELLNKQKFADAAVLTYNTMKGFTKLEEKEPYVLRYCALFMNTDDEDRRMISEDQITQKIQDWQEEGYAIQDFLAFALNSIPSFIESYRSATQSISEKKSQ
jgi:hypothetical protein